MLTLWRIKWTRMTMEKSNLYQKMVKKTTTTKTKTRKENYVTSGSSFHKHIHNQKALLKWGLEIWLERSRNWDLRLKFISLFLSATDLVTMNHIYSDLSLVTVENKPLSGCCSIMLYNYSDWDQIQAAFIWVFKMAIFY